MDTLEAKRKARKAARSWLSRDINKLNHAISAVEPTKNEISACLQYLEKRINNLELIQSEVEALIDDDELEADIEEASGHIDRYQAAKLRAEEVLSTLNDHQEVVDTSSVENEPTTPQVNLPKLNLPRFGGNPLEFFPFWERFEVAVNSTKIPDVNKFIYLKSVLDGDALAAVRGLAMTPDNYGVAKEIILDRFGRKEKIIFHHVECLLNFKDLRHSRSVKDL